MNKIYKHLLIVMIVMLSGCTSMSHTNTVPEKNSHKTEAEPLVTKENASHFASGFILGVPLGVGIPMLVMMLAFVVG